MDLLSGLSYCRRGRDDLWSNYLVVQLPRTQLINRRLIQTDHTSERTADQVQFILNDQVGRSQQRMRSGPGSRKMVSLGVVRILVPENEP